MEEPKSNDAKWYEIFKQKSWWQTLLSTKPVLAFSIVLVPIGIIAYFIYKKGQTDNEASNLQNSKYAPVTPVTPAQEEEYKSWTRTRLPNLENQIFDLLDSFFWSTSEMFNTLKEISELDDRRLITLESTYQTLRKKSFRNELYKKSILGFFSTGTEINNYKNLIVKRLDTLK